MLAPTATPAAIPAVVAVEESVPIPTNLLSVPPPPDGLLSL